MVQEVTCSRSPWYHVWLNYSLSVISAHARVGSWMQVHTPLSLQSLNPSTAQSVPFTPDSSLKTPCVLCLHVNAAQKFKVLDTPGTNYNQLPIEPKEVLQTGCRETNVGSISASQEIPEIVIAQEKLKQPERRVELFRDSKSLELFCIPLAMHF